MEVAWTKAKIEAAIDEAWRLYRLASEGRVDWGVLLKYVCKLEEEGFPHIEELKMLVGGARSREGGGPREEPPGEGETAIDLLKRCRNVECRGLTIIVNLRGGRKAYIELNLRGTEVIDVRVEEPPSEREEGGVEEDYEGELEEGLREAFEEDLDSV